MPITITNESKNEITITNNAKPAGLTWDEATFAWDEATSPWDAPGTVLTRDSKNNLTITNESKS